MKKLEKVSVLALSLLSTASFFGCGSDSSSGTESGADVNPVSSVCGEFTAFEDGLGNTYCLNSSGAIEYSVLADGTVLYPEVLASSSSANGEIVDPTLSSSSAASFICNETSAPLSIIGTRYFYSDAAGSYYYDLANASCEKTYLSAIVSSSSEAIPSGNESSSSVMIPEISSSSNFIIPISSVAIIPNENDPILTFNESALTIEKNNQCVDTAGTVVKILCAGNYYLAGSTSSYEILVAADTTAKVYLYLNGLSLTSPDDAAIYVQNANKVFLYAVDGTTNQLGDAATRNKVWSFVDEGETKNDTTRAVVYSKKDLTLKGNGSLTVNVSCADTSLCGNGIHTTKDLKIKDAPTLSVTAKKNALKGKRSVEIEGGNITLTSTLGDGIKSDEDEAEKLASGKGRIVITGGTFSITAKDDGVKASNFIVIADSVSSPTMTITANAGKGIVSDSLVNILAGKVTVTAGDDGIHSNGSILFNGGETTVTAGDDGIHADSALHVNDGSINIVKAVEGMEAWFMYFDGGVTSTYATDDGWNAAGGTAVGSSGSSGSMGGWGGMGGGPQSSSHGYAYIRGGYHYVSASGNDIDVLDANGTATQTGGVLILEIPSSNGGGMGGGSGCSTNQSGGLIDTDDGFTISGGVLLGFGSQTESYPSCSSTSYTNANYYGSANAAFKPQGSGSMIIYGGDVASVSTVDVSGMNSITFPNGMQYYYK